jgi:hypothetical protein
MPITNNNKYEIHISPAMDLIGSLYDFVNGHREDVEDSYVKKAALCSCKSRPKTALHRILYYLAYNDFYLNENILKLDDEDIISIWESLIPHMGLKLPHHYSTMKGLSNFLTDDKFKIGLNRIVDSAFAILWSQKHLLYEFNLLLAEYISSCKKKEFPKIFKKNGVLDRKCQSSWPQWLRKQILYRDRGFCQYCGKRVSDIDLFNDDYDIDHMVPLENGGTFDPTNLILACRSCNRSKGKKYVPVVDFFTWPERNDFKGI